MEISSSIFRAIETSNWFKTIRSKDPLQNLKEAFLLFESLLSKIKYDVIKLLLNLNILVTNDNNREKKIRLKVRIILKKLVEMKNVRVDQVKI